MAIRERFQESLDGESGPGITLGGIAQLVEHELCKLGVTGSNPVASTISSVDEMGV